MGDQGVDQQRRLPGLDVALPLALLALCLSGCGRVITEYGALPMATASGDAAERGSIWVYSPPVRPGEAGRVIQIAPAQDDPSPKKKLEPSCDDDCPTERADRIKGVW